MKNSLYVTVLSLLLLSSGVFAEAFHMQYYGQTIDQVLHLKKGDVVAIDTYIPVNTRFRVVADVPPMNAEAMDNFIFSTSLDSVGPYRHYPFYDNVLTGANPGWMTYTFQGDKEIDAHFRITP